MQVSTEKKDGVKYVLTVTVPADEVSKAYNLSLKNCAKNAKLDGFRKGHIPTKLLVENFSHRIEADALEFIISNNLGKAVSESKLDVVGYPTIDMAESSLKKDQDFTFKAIVEVTPELEIKPYADLKIKKVVSTITDADIDSMIENLRKQQGKWQVQDDAVVAKDTRISIDFTGRTDGVEFEGGKAQNFDIIVGQTQMIPGFVEQIEGHKAGDKFTIQVKFPEEYHAENLKGKDAEFDIVVNAVSTLSLPEVNEDFVKVFGIKDGSVDTFKADLRKNMQRELDRALYVQNRSKLFDALVDQYGEFEVPSAYVKSEQDRLKQNFVNQMKAYGMKKVPTELLDNDEGFKDDAIKAARLGVIVRKIMVSENINKPNDSYVEAQLTQIAQAYEEPEEVKAQIRKNKSQFENVENAAMEAEFVDKLLSQACDGEESKGFSELVGRR